MQTTPDRYGQGEQAGRQVGGCLCSRLDQRFELQNCRRRVNSVLRSGSGQRSEPEQLSRGPCRIEHKRGQGRREAALLLQQLGCKGYGSKRDGLPRAEGAACNSDACLYGRQTSGVVTCNRTDVEQAIRNPSERYLSLASGATGELRVRSALKEQRHLKLGARLQRERAERLLAAALTPPVAQPDASGKHGI